MSEAPENGAAGVAIVGMAGRFPGAADVEKLWENLKAGVESVTFFSREELEAAGVEPRLLDDPDYVPARAVLDGPDRFDAALFGFSPREAEVLDPQHRLLLECAWEALECAGYDPRRYDGLIGVYAGTGPNAYLLFNLIHNRDVLGTVGQFQAMLGNGGDFLATRLSYKLGLRGPSLTVQTACSTSLVAVHLAAQSLLNGECDMALAGGVRVSVPQRAGYLFQPDGILSPDGHCRPFDEEARGAIDGDGAAIVVLKRLDDALADGDRIHAVILGTAINNDGSGKVGYTAPAVDGQAGAIAMAQALAAVHPETVGLIEGHGTGTPLGDPVEVAALRQVFEAATARRGFCALGSVKGNVGHLDAAAGVTSLIKAALALEREVIPPTLHFRRPNPRLGLEESPFFVNAGPLPWPSGPEPRRAGVSSFGMGGTNAHVVLEEAPPVPAGDPSSHPAQVLVLSAATAPALEEMTDRLAKWLERHPDLDLADVAFTLQVGRQVLPHRRALVCRDVDEAREALRSRRVRSRVQEPESRPVAFLGDGESEAARTWREWGIVPDVVLEEGLDLAAVLERPGAVLVDLGTGRLAERARRHPLFGPGHVVVSSGDMLEALTELWLAGVEVDWRGFHGGERRLRVALPAYPFERRRYWIESPHPLAPSPATPHPLPGRGGNEEDRQVAVGGGAPLPGRAGGVAGEGTGVRASSPRPPLSTPFVAPRTDLERRLASFFRDLLGVDPVGAFDSFFEIGGHSLLGLQLIGRVRSELGAEVPLEALFQAATVADLAELVGLIEAEKTAVSGIPRVPRDGDLPLSFAQERLWFLDRLDPGTPAFNLNQAVRLTGALDVHALAAALREVVRRHESLRTAFLDVQGRPVQRVLPAVEVPLPVVDLSALPGELGERESGRLATRAGDRRFDLARPPLLAAELYRLAPDRHAVALVLHHIVGDGWSIAVLLTELAETYRALAAGEPSPLPVLEVQYPDFASWQRSRLGDAEIERQLAEWRAQLAPPLPVLDLPTDRPRPAVQTFRGAGELLTLPPDLAEALRALGRAQGATPFMALLSAFSLVLSRWSGQEDVIVGSPIAGRDRRELEPLIGIFLNMLPLRLDLSGGPGFRALLGRAREVALAAYARQDVPVERLIEEVQPERDLSRSPLFQVLFNLQDFPRRALDVPGLAIEALPVREVPSRFDLTVYGEEAAGGAIALELVYNADLFDAATVRQLLAQLRQAIAAGVEEPDTPVSRLSLVTPEAAAVLPDPRAPLPAAWTGAVHERFAARARLHPERPAVIDAAGTWTYGDLAQRAGRLARRLRAEGIGRGDLVAVYAHRSAPLVQALLGVLEAGAAFLILDPAHPPLRLRAALSLASPRAFLEIEAAGPVPETLAEGIPASVLWLRLGEVKDVSGGEALETGPDDLAYVAFTSGSTGQPKGILGSHGPLSHFCDWHSVRFPLGAGDRFSLLSGLSHDPLLRDVFTPLGLGATLCIPEPDDLGSPVRLAGWMARQRVTVSHLTPALGQILADGGTALPDLRHVFFGGDVLAEGDVARLRAKAPDAVCVNFYGATETPQAVAWFDASAAGGWPARRVPIGRGIEGVQLLVLNEAGGLAAPGELGEVCVRTRYLALGYLDGERFGDTYRTGDLGRYRPDGAVVLAGRRDDQVQVRGFRVEPAEVEAALALHPAVRDAAVLLRGQVLTAWLVAAAGPLPETGDLRDFLRQRLPDPMVPEAFVWLDRLPLTPNGKLDRRALPDPEPERRTGAQVPVDPADPVEDRLAALWRELLGLDRIGRHDNFFALGGHSLLATRLVARIHEAFGVDLPLRHLFEAPTVAGLARRIAGGEDREEAGPAEPVETAPVSFSQRRIWFLDRLEPGSAAYNLPFAVRLLGPLSVEALARAFTGIVRRHEPLRTTFTEEGGEPVQVIAPPAPVPLPLADLTGLPPERRDPEALRLAAGEAARPFDLARGPLFRPLLLRVAPDAHVVSATMHHVVTDGWSTGILLRELGALYTGLPLPELRSRYADFAAWQRRWLEGPEPAGHVEYWKRRLQGAPVLELPADRPRPAVRRGRGATVPVALPSDLVLALGRLARGESATLYMALLAAFQVLLYRYTGQEDLVVGSPVAGRERPEVQDLIGFFVNALALRSRLRDEEPFRAFLGRVRDVCLEAYAHQELPFDKLVEEIQPERSLARAPVFQVVLSLEERPREARLPGLEIRPLPVHTGASKFDLNLLLAAGDGRLEGFVEYDADLFEPDTVRRLVGHFGNLLAAAVAGPGQRISELPLMGEAELRQTLTPPAPLSRHPFPPPRERGETLPGLFAAQAARRPDAVALSFEGEALTYGELDRRAGHVARQLRGLGVGPEVPVALWCERDLRLPVAVLGVLAAGGVYVPVDPAWPAERVAFVLADSGSRLLLRGPGTPTPPAPPSVQVVELNGGAGDEPFPTRAAAPDHAAYVIYTSGSTGRPKGVAVTHGNVTRLLAATQPWFGFGEGDVWTLFHSYAFDFSVWEIWGALAHGGRLVVVPFWAGRSPEALTEVLEREGVTVLNQTPSAFYALLDAERRTGRVAAPALSWVVFGGEALDAGRLAPWWERHAADRPRLVNMYGITETTVHVTFRPVLPEDAWSGAGSAVGQAIPDLSVHVLGPGLVPVPLGVPGELHVGGAGLARGYLGRPDLTAERFVPDPWAGEPGARLYRTGDLGRRRASGELEYLGRVDRQVKVRGFRIEPGEIEAVLARHPAVAEAAVLVRDDLPGGRGLAAFWAATGAEAVGAHELRVDLKEHLPEPLVPAAFVRLDRLPVTANGKVDRRALAALPIDTARTEPSFTAPRTPAEELLAGLWSELLGRERVAADDDFFELGGHSLLATQLVSRVRETLGIELPLRAVFQAPTLAAMAAALSRTGGEEAAPPIVPVDREGDLPLSFAQQRLWFLDRLVPGNPFFVMAFGLRLEGRLDAGALRQALNEVVRRQGSLRTTFPTVDGEPRQRVAGRLEVDLPLVDLSVREDELRALGQGEARRHFDLRRGPLLRALLVRLGAEDHVLLLHLHHIIADGWSMGVLRRELSLLYDAFAGGRPSPLPELPVQYADFAVWQRRWLTGEALERQLGYWRRQLAGVPPVLELPLDRPRPAVETFRGGVSGFSLEAGLVERLRALGRSLGCTLSMTALAAYDLLLARYTRRDDVVVGSGVANRNRRETEELIGFFVNVLVLRADLSGDPTFAGFAGRVREMSLDAYAHQDLPFEKLVEELQLPRDLAHHPLCQAMYGFQNFPRHELRVRGLAMTPLEGEALDTGTAKADITLFLAEADGALHGWIEFNGDLFEETTIRRMQRHLTALLEAAAADPGRPVSALPMLGESERHQLLREWSGTAAAVEPPPFLASRFLERVRETPDAAALVWREGTVSYGGLHRRAARLARRLRDLGVAPEVRVGLRLERPEAMIEGILGVSLAGGAWLPLDPDYPPARLDLLLSDAGCRVLLTDGDLLLPGDGGGPGAPDLLPGNLAYVIYTSGSTGRPKGVAVTQGGLARITDSLIRVYGIRPGDRFLMTMSPSFDAYVAGLAVTLGAGATVHVAGRDERMPGPPLAALLRERGITVLDLMPSLVALLEPDEAASVRTLILGGEVCPPELAARWAPGRRVYIAYGPTETTVVCTVGRYEPGGHPPILGRPLAGARVHLLDGLDGRMEPVPAGVPAELFAAGEGVARGYLHRPDLTAERFLPDPFGPAGSRLYRTGDLARRLPDGNLEFLGRVDEQVKLRGFRVEPGEVEARLAGHPEVATAVVVARGQGLVAYVVPKHGGREGQDEPVESWQAIDEELQAREEADPFGRLAPRLVPELRAWAQEALPEFLVPSAFVVLESLPRTPSGKVDRRALPAPELAGAVPGEEVAPRTPVEIEVAEVFRDLLGRERLGAGTDFFAAGGHSLLATQAVSRLRERFGVELALRELFEAPTVAGLARRIETALAERRSLEVPPLRPVPRDVPPPLSFAQERLWFLDQLDAGRSPWSLFSGIRFLGPLGLPALAAALDELARRHESLRTTFAVEGGRPVQVIAPEPRLALPLVDLSRLPAGPREAEATRWIDREAQRPFDLAAGPLMRALALRLGPDEHAVAIVLHHIVSDGWSMGVLNRDLGGLYGAFAAGRPSPLAPLPVQYADFAVWQRSWLQGEALERQLGYWRERLAGAPPVLALPLDRPRPAVRAFQGRRRIGALAPQTVAALSALARRSGATLFMTLLAAWQALLFRVTGEPDLVVGTPVANRDRVELEELIGLFVNTLAMRTDLSGSPGFLGVLERVRQAALGAFAHQDLPFEKLVEELAPERDLRHTPVFQAFFAFEEEAQGPPDVPGLSLVPMGAENRSVKFDLTLLARRLGAGLELVVAYNSDLFHAATAERLLGQLRTLIGSAAADPGRPVSELPLLSEPQRHQLLLGWNDTAREIEPLPLHRIFEAQAACRPDRTALVAPGGSLTYGELDRRAGRLARLLAREGVGPEARVALCLGRSPGLVTSILAVLKAGGAWVPLDPDLPRERLAFLLKDSGSSLLITEERLLGSLPEDGVPLLVLDLEREALEREDGPALPPELSPDSLAYVIYTSGSTGQPKGVAVTHRGLASLARAQVEAFGLDAGDRVLQFASPAFDASVSELAVAWQSGAELHLASPGDLLPGASLVALLRERGITNVTLPPTALAVTPPEDLPRLRSLVVAGEPCPPGLAELWSAGRRFTNAYGPTETTVCATVGAYEPGSLRMTLGRPIANARVHLLDPAGVEPVAAGVAGELCVAGPGLARGYLDRPDLTAGRFVPDPWGAPGGRLYRTGDLARWLDDGRIELLGRIDEQVKVRGFRVEPGEVRAALLTHPEVREAEVLAPADARGERRLVAWIAADAGAQELREYLEERLPDWLVPSRFVFLDALPKTAGGKVDRRALPSPDDGAGRAIEGRREPADALERLLLEIWREVLGLASIGMEEDFFALGGTSLRAAILTNLLQERLGDYVYAVALFDAPTIAQLARYLEQHYPVAVARVRGEQPVPEEERGERVDAGMVTEIRRLIGSRPRLRTEVKNPRAVFVLSPPRSGSTLLRVLLAGNSRLFAPPELELLGFDTLGERARELSGRFALWREGVVRAVMEARGCGFEEADALLAAMEAEDLPVAELYRRLQAWTAGRTLVDKTPSYALDRSVLERAEELFDQPLYIHLVRHPYATVASFEEAKLEQVFFRPRHSFTRRQLAELIWQVSHRNILDFLETVPAERQLRVRFENLVRRPRAEMERASAFLGVSFEEGMLAPYDQGARKMTDGVHSLSRMLGDVKFHTHSRVDPEVADRWKTVYRRDFLGDDTWELARDLGYEERAGAPRHPPLVTLRAGGTEPPLFLVHPLGGSAASYRELAARLDAGRPVYGLQALGLGAGEEPQDNIEEMAAYYIDQVRRVAPGGPYHLGGWSLGGVIAFEMAQQLVRAGERVDLLALFDAVVPNEIPRDRYDSVSILRGLAWELGNMTGLDLKVSPEELRGLSGEEGVRYLLQRAQQSGALPPGFGVDQAVRTWRIIDASAVAFRSYRARVYPGRALLFVAEQSRREGLGPELGWNRFVAGGVERILLEARHSTVLRDAALETIVEKLKTCLLEERVAP